MSEYPRASAQKSKASRRKKLIFFIVAPLLVIVTVGAMVASRKREKPIMVTTDKAFTTNITQLVTATGKIQPEVEVKIAPEVSGEIIELPVKEGQQVHRGDLLMKIKPDSYVAQVEAQEAALSGARAASVERRAQLDKAKQDYDRAVNLHKSKLLSDTDLNAAKTNYEIAKAGLESALFDIQRAEGSLRQIRDALSKTTIYSPADGTISTLPARRGERVVGTSQFAGTEVMRIANLEAMEAVVDVNENDVVNVKIGDSARINVDAYPDRALKGIVREIASTASTRNAGSQEEVTNFQVKISIPDHSVVLRPGMSTTADIETATVNNVIAVPIQAVTVRSSDSKLSPEEMEKQTARRDAADKVEDNRADVTNEQLEKQKARAEREKLQRVVFIKNGDTVKMQKVETGISDSTYVEVKKGLKPGDEVVSGSYTVVSRKLKEGARVAIEKQGKG